MHRLSGILRFVVLITLVAATGFANASDATSTNFILRDVVVGAGGGYASSAGFQMLSQSSEILSGRGLTSASFEGRFGIQYYPYSASGVLTAVQNGVDIDLSWTASEATLGLGVSGYAVGIASIEGGPYSYTSVGGATTYTYTGLTPGTYYFVFQTIDNLGNVIAVSNEETVVLPQSISFSLSDTSIGFGVLSGSVTKYATGDTLGATSETEAHQLTAATNAPYGYSISVRGAAPTKGPATISPIGGSNTAPVSGTDQFGLRMIASGGSASIASPYDASGFAYAADAVAPSEIATNSASDAISTTFSARYVANVSSTTPSGAYETALVYTITANF